jgi:hypothetical protein
MTGCDWATQKSKDAAGRRDATIGYTLDALGIAAIGVAVALYYHGDHESTIAVAPRTQEHGAAVSWSGSW